jgi:hypothetical protein
MKIAMLDRRAFLLAAAASLLAAGQPLAAQANDPLAIVSAIYARAIKEDGGGFLTLEHAERKKYMSKSLVALWKKAEDNTPKGDVLIDADQVSNSQDPDIKSFTVKQERREANRAMVAATFTESGDRGRKSALDLTVRYDFVREGDRWMIDDIRGTVDGKPWSIRENLEHSLKF